MEDPTRMAKIRSWCCLNLLLYILKHNSVFFPVREIKKFNLI